MFLIIWARLGSFELSWFHMDHSYICGCLAAWLGSGWSRVASHISGGWLALCWMMEGDWGTCLSSFIRQVWACLCGGRILREVVETCRVSWGLHLELAQCHFCHVLLAKASHKARPDSRCGKMNSACWWEGLHCHIAAGMDSRRAGELEPFYVIVLPYTLILHESLHRSECFWTCKNGKESNDNLEIILRIK